MRIAGWHVDGYGVLAGYDVGGLPPGLSVVTGPNEAGKSTLLDFLRGVLFGFPDRRSRQPFREPLRGGRHGGRVELLDEAGGRWLLTRHVGGRGPELVGPDGRIAAEASIRELLGGADAALFRSVFAFGLDELASFSTLDSEAVRDAVFSAGILGAGRSASSAARALRQRREALARPRQPDAPANRLLAELHGLDESLRSARREAHAHPLRSAEAARLAGEVAAARAALDALRRRGEEIERLLTCWPVQCRAEAARQELAALGAPDERVAALLAAEAAIERLLAERSGHVERLGREQQLAVQLAGIERERDELLDRLGPMLAGAEPSMARPAAGLRADAEALHGESHVASAACQAATGELERALGELSLVQAEADPAWARPGSPRPLADLDELDLLADELGREVTERDRLRAEQASAEQLRRLAELADARTSRLAAPAVAALVALGTATAALAVLAAVTAQRRAAVALAALLLAAALAATALVIGIAARRPRRAPGVDAVGADATGGALAACAARVEVLAARLGLGDEPTAAAAGALAARLRVERAERARADSHGHQLARARCAAEAARGRLGERRSELAKLTARCQALCEAASLPPLLGPDGLVQALSWLDDLARLDAARQRVRGPLERLRAENAAFEDEVRAVLGALPGSPAARSPGAGAPGAGSRADAVARPGVGDEVLAAGASLRRAVEQRELRAKATRALEESEEELARLLGAGGHAEALRAALRTGDVLGWEQRRHAVAAELADAAAAHEAAVGAHRDAERALEELERSGGVAELELRRSVVAAQLERTLEDWVVHSLAESLLAATLARYERDRQPVVVARAAALFAEVTSGRYGALLARASGDGGAGTGPGIDALSAGGERVDCGALSRGTAEQLYLCLRLAYAATFAERAVSLPLVLDDVLVNFDPARARAVAGVVAAVAEDHQVLAFTCHPHVVELFLEAAPQAGVVELAPAAAPTAQRAG